MRNVSLSSVACRLVIRPVWSLCVVCLMHLTLSASLAHAGENDHFAGIYGGRLTDGNWRDSLRGSADFVDASLLVGQLGWTYLRSQDGGWSLEIEGQAARHFGDQHHWELNALTSARWHAFPWNDHVATTAAIGVGVSYATSLPAVEVAVDGSSSRMLLYWHLELTLGPPDADWTALLRLHHRSASYGLFSEDGGSNALTAGVRYFF